MFILELNKNIYKNILYIILTILLSNQANSKQLPYSPIIEGSGLVIRDERQLPPIKKIVISGIAELSLKQSTKNFLITETESNLISMLNIKIKNDTLLLSQKHTSIFPRYPIKYILHSNTVKNIILHEQTKLLCSDGFKTDFLDLYFTDKAYGNMRITCNKLNIKLENNASLILAGRATEQNIMLKQSAGFYGNNLVGKFGKITITSNGIAKVNILEQLTANIMNKGTLKYLGSPSLISNPSML